MDSILSSNSTLGRSNAARGANGRDAAAVQLNKSNGATAATSDASQINLREFYHDKVILCTGCTGFLGKVFAEKMLRCIPTVKKFYVLIRPKKGTSPTERLRKEVLESKIFDQLRKEYGGKEAFERFALSKLVPVTGDVSVDSLFLDMSEEQVEKVRNEVQLVLHCAATIDFQERLDNAIMLNTFGTIRMLEFAKTCPNIQGFCHVSTAYTNCNQPSGTTVMEKQYALEFPNGESVFEFCDRVMRMDKNEPEKIIKLTEKYLKHFGYPNTYTFTKNMAEQLVVQRRGHVPVAVVRPTIIGSAFKEPVPGWVDAITAAAATYFFVGLGILSVLKGDAGNISDQIPVDYVSHAMAACLAAVAIESKETGKPIMRTFHSGSSARNPVTWGLAFDISQKYWVTHRPKKGIAKPDFRMVSNPLTFQTRFFTSYTSMTTLFSVLAALTRNKKHANLAQQLKKVENRAMQQTDNFHHFTLNEWVFSDENMVDVMRRLTPEDQESFFLDTTKIDWVGYLNYMNYGLHKYVLKEEPTLPTKVNVAQTYAHDWFADIQFALGTKSDFIPGRSTAELKRAVLLSSKVQHAIQQEAINNSLTFAEVEERAQSVMNVMFAEPAMSAVRVLAYLFRKVWRRLYESVLVDDQDLDRLRNLHKDSNSGPVIIIPTQKSYIDTFILGITLISYDLPMPLVATGEEFLGLTGLHPILRYAGSFFIKRPLPKNDALYTSIYTEYIQQLLVDGASLQYFIEGTRARGGKSIQPKMDFLNVVLDAYLNHKIPNATIVPVHIGYEKVIEAELYTKELLGEQKTPETLANLLAARNIMNRKYGDIDVKFAEPIALSKYVEQVVEEQRKKSGSFDPFEFEKDKQMVVRGLAYQIMLEMNRAAVVMPTSLIATIVLNYRSSGISMEELTEKVVWLKEQVERRGASVNWGDKGGASATSAVLKHSLGLMKDVLNINTTANMVEPKIVKGKDYKNLIQLSVYRNQLAHLFSNEAVVCAALHSFGEQAHREGVSRQELLKESKLISRLLRIEFVSERVDLNQLINIMVDREILALSKTGDSICLPASGKHSMYQLLLNMVFPFIEAYWVTSLALCSIPGLEVKEIALVQKIQWLAEKSFLEGKLSFYESCSLETIKNAISAFIDFGVLTRSKRLIVMKDSSTVEEAYVSISAPYSTVDSLVQLVKNLGRFTKDYKHSASNIKDIARGDVMPNFLVISRL